MAMHSRVQLLAEDIWDTPDDENRYEVIDGELYATPPSSWAHQHVVSELLTILRTFASYHGLGEVYGAPLGVVLERTSGSNPTSYLSAPVARRSSRIVGSKALPTSP